MSKKLIFSAIRLRMKISGMTYAELAKHLNVSETSVKRYFSEERMTVDTLDSICVALQTPLDAMLAEYKKSSPENAKSFTIEQEDALAASEQLFAIYFMVAGGWGFDDIVKNHEISPAELTRTLRELEDLELVSFQTNAALLALLPIDAEWRVEGPLFKKFKAQAVHEFFDSDFMAANELLKLTFGPMLPDSAQIVRKKMISLQNEIQKIVEIDSKHITDIAAASGYWFVTALRPMSFSVIRNAVMQNIFTKKQRQTRVP